MLFYLIHTIKTSWDRKLTEGWQGEAFYEVAQVVLFWDLLIWVVITAVVQSIEQWLLNRKPIRWKVAGHSNEVEGGALPFDSKPSQSSFEYTDCLPRGHKLAFWSLAPFFVPQIYISGCVFCFFFFFCRPHQLRLYEMSRRYGMGRATKLFSLALRPSGGLISVII